MGKTTPSRLFVLAVWTSFIISIISVESITLRPCPDNSPAGKRKSCLTQLPERRCHKLAKKRLSQTMEQTMEHTIGRQGDLESIALTSAGCGERSGEEKLRLHWKTRDAKRPRSYLIILRVARKEGHTYSCYHATQKRGKRRQRRAAKGKRKGGGRKKKTVSAELFIAEDYTRVRAFILEAPSSVKKLKRISPSNLSTAKSVEYRPIPTPPQEVRLNLSDFEKLPDKQCKSLYTDGEYKSKHWPKKGQVNLIPLQDAHQSIPHHFSIQCNVSERGAGYLIVAEVYDKGSKKYEACRCFYFCPSAYVQQNETCKELKVHFAFNVKGNYSGATVGVLLGDSLKEPKNFFKNTREHVILKHFNRQLGRVEYEVPPPPTPPTAPVQPGESCYSWKPSGRSPHQWYSTENGLLLEVFACPANQLAHNHLLYLTPCNDHSHSVSEVRLSKKQCAGNLTVPNNDTYGRCWAVMLSWDCHDCPEAAKLNGGSCRTKFLEFDDNVTVPPQYRHGYKDITKSRTVQPLPEPWFGVVVAVGVTVSSGVALSVAMLLVHWRRKKTERRCRTIWPSAVYPWTPAISVLHPQRSAFIIYWRDHELHRKATSHLAAMLRSLGLKVAIDVDSADDIRKGRDKWLRENLNSSSSIIIIASSGLLQACRRRLLGQENPANNSDIYDDLAPAALDFLGSMRMANPHPRRQQQQVILVSLGYDSSCLAGFHDVLFSVDNLHKVVLAARPPKDETDRTGVPNSTEVHADLYGFFYKLTGCRDKAMTAAQSESARLFEKARLGMQKMRAQREGPVLAQSAS